MKTEKHWKDIFVSIISQADVIFEILDARNPIGTRNNMLEDFIKKNAPDKELFLVLNKIDLIPRNVLRLWIYYLKTTTPFKIFGVSALHKRGILFFKHKLNLIYPHAPMKGIITGYPNTGKSSLIAALAGDRKKVGISSRAGFTRAVMEFKITERITLIDTPGVIPLSEEDEIDHAIKGIINPDKVFNKVSVVYQIIDVYVPPLKILEHYDIDEDFIRKSLNSDIAERIIERYCKTAEKIQQIQSEDFEDIIELIGKKRGLLAQGGAVNDNQVYITIMHDWQKNRIKYFMLPPISESDIKEDISSIDEEIDYIDHVEELNEDDQIDEENESPEDTLEEVNPIEKKKVKKSTIKKPKKISK
jgi:ribosome biogenesis GTPase A